MPEALMTPPSLGRFEIRKFSSLEEILDYAIDLEQQAADFYIKLAPKMSKPRLRGLFLNFSREEERHKVRLMEVRHTGKKLSGSEQEVDEMHIADFVPAIEPSLDMDEKDALLLAMNEEKAAFRIYKTLADKTHNDAFKKVFEILAQEEAKHKLFFETAYEDYIWERL